MGILAARRPAFQRNGFAGISPPAARSPAPGAELPIGRNLTRMSISKRQAVHSLFDVAIAIKAGAARITLIVRRHQPRSRPVTFAE